MPICVYMQHPKGLQVCSSFRWIEPEIHFFLYTPAANTTISPEFSLVTPACSKFHFCLEIAEAICLPLLFHMPFEAR